MGLRTGLFTMVNGESWHPNCNLDSVEIHPLYIWEPGDKWTDI